MVNYYNQSDNTDNTFFFFNSKVILYKFSTSSAQNVSEFWNIGGFTQVTHIYRVIIVDRYIMVAAGSQGVFIYEIAANFLLNQLKVLDSAFLQQTECVIKDIIYEPNLNYLYILNAKLGLHLTTWELGSTVFTHNTSFLIKIY